MPFYFRAGHPRKCTKLRVFYIPRLGYVANRGLATRFNVLMVRQLNGIIYKPHHKK